MLALDSESQVECAFVYFYCYLVHATSTHASDEVVAGIIFFKSDSLADYGAMNKESYVVGKGLSPRDLSIDELFECTWDFFAVDKGIFLPSIKLGSRQR